jgi:hypothetical protein
MVEQIYRCSAGRDLFAIFCGTTTPSRSAMPTFPYSRQFGAAEEFERCQSLSKGRRMPHRDFGVVLATSIC